MPRARSQINNADMLRRLGRGLEMRQQSIVPTLNEGVQAVVILADLVDRQQPLKRDAMGYVRFALVGAETGCLVVLLNPGDATAFTPTRASGVRMVLRGLDTRLITTVPALTDPVQVELTIASQSQLDTALGFAVSEQGTKNLGHLTQSELARVPLGQIRAANQIGAFAAIGSVCSRWSVVGINEHDPNNAVNFGPGVGEHRPFTLFPGTALVLRNLNTLAVGNGLETTFHWTEEELGDKP